MLPSTPRLTPFCLLTGILPLFSFSLSFLFVFQHLQHLLVDLCFNGAHRTHSAIKASQVTLSFSASLEAPLPFCLCVSRSVHQSPSPFPISLCLHNPSPSPPAAWSRFRAPKAPLASPRPSPICSKAHQTLSFSVHIHHSRYYTARTEQHGTHPENETDSTCVSTTRLEAKITEHNPVTRTLSIVPVASLLLSLGPSSPVCSILSCGPLCRLFGLPFLQSPQRELPSFATQEPIGCSPPHSSTALFDSIVSYLSFVSFPKLWPFILFLLPFLFLFSLFHQTSSLLPLSVSSPIHQHQHQLI